MIQHWRLNSWRFWSKHSFCYLHIFWKSEMYLKSDFSDNHGCFGFNFLTMVQTEMTWDLGTNVTIENNTGKYIFMILCHNLNPNFFHRLFFFFSKNCSCRSLLALIHKGFVMTTLKYTGSEFHSPSVSIQLASLKNDSENFLPTLSLSILSFPFWNSGSDLLPTARHQMPRTEVFGYFCRHILLFCNCLFEFLELEVPFSDRIFPLITVIVGFGRQSFCYGQITGRAVSKWNKDIVRDMQEELL